MTTAAPPPWADDPLEVDRFLDGELDPVLRAHREADVARDPVLAGRVAGRRAFLAALAAAGAAARPPATDVDRLEARVRVALRQASRPRPLRLLARPPVAAAVAAAALVLLAIGLGLFRSRPDTLAPGARLAWEAWAEGRRAEAPVLVHATCGPERTTSPWRFPLVERRELGVRGCRDEDPEPGVGPTTAILYRPGDSETVGYVALPAPGVQPSHDVGVLRLRDVVIFDVQLGGAVYYLAVARELVERGGSCAACHGRSREGLENPHVFLERRLPGTLPDAP